jgi:hypothetical protein
MKRLAILTGAVSCLAGFTSAHAQDALTRGDVLQLLQALKTPQPAATASPNAPEGIASRAGRVRASVVASIVSPGVASNTTFYCELFFFPTNSLEGEQYFEYVRVRATLSTSRTSVSCVPEIFYSWPQVYLTAASRIQAGVWIKASGGTSPRETYVSLLPIPIPGNNLTANVTVRGRL